MECKRTMKRLKLKIPVATIIFCAAALTGCWSPPIWLFGFIY